MFYNVFQFLFQVEIKDATVKTFAEIMAEKKRKRLEAQQTNKKSYTHISFDDLGKWTAVL